jgi:hypothetical protein
MKCNAGSKQAVLPKHPIPGAMGSIELICYILICKYCDGLPLYRLENILARYGGELSRATLANWVIALARPLQPLINLIREHQLAGDIIMADETRVQVLKEPGRPATSGKFMWVTLGGSPEQPSVLFEYDPSRSQDVPLRLLDGFHGYLQTDGYAGYNAACLVNHITQLGCWDHARRKFKDAQDAQPKPKKGHPNKRSKADHILSLINTLYMIERQIKELSAAEKFQHRCKRSLPTLKKLKAYYIKNMKNKSDNAMDNDNFKWINGCFTLVSGHVKSYADLLKQLVIWLGELPVENKERELLIGYFREMLSSKYKKSF